MPGIRNFVRDNVKDVIEILGTLMKTGMTVNAKKCRFGLSEVEIVGFICNIDGRKPTGSKIDRINSWPTPTNLKELRGFLGITCFYRIWIENYSIIADPLYKLLRKDQDYIWEKDQEKSFGCLKSLITRSPILRPPQYGEGAGKIILTVDASPVEVGGVLHQEDKIV
ncbi:Transposon Tf2-11 polyprotein [Smittium culicis]|uniref:Transposon Tf2-11 polyprotein n=1 Tax=Smittium culicis TaxID=133412 RepID=A0A1R1YMA9_9FUNG|nr:Transposon Tf2-11 polyprotein [Smittium culicis]